MIAMLIFGFFLGLTGGIVLMAFMRGQDDD